MIYFKRAAQEYTEPYITVKRGDRKLRTIIHAPVILKYPSTRPQNLKNDKMLNFWCQNPNLSRSDFSKILLMTRIF